MLRPSLHDQAVINQGLSQQGAYMSESDSFMSHLIELRGRLAIPGFIEGHGHFVGLGEAMMNLDLSVARSWEEVIEIVGEAARRTPPKEWIASAIRPPAVQWSGEARPPS